MSFVDFIQDGLRDPLGFFVLSYLLGAAMCGAWALAIEPLIWKLCARSTRGSGNLGYQLKVVLKPGTVSIN